MTSSTPKKCRATSSIVPRHANRGRSWIVPRGIRHGPGCRTSASIVAGRSCRSVWLPQKSPTGRRAVRVTRVRVDDEPVALVAERPVAGGEREDDVAVPPGSGRDRQPVARRRPKTRGEQLAHAAGLRGSRADDDSCGPPERERAALGCLGERLRDHRREARRRALRALEASAAIAPIASTTARATRSEAAHPLTAPDVSPNAIRRWTSRKNTITGIAVSVEAAISAPQSVFLLVP